VSLSRSFRDLYPRCKIASWSHWGEERLCADAKVVLQCTGQQLPFFVDLLVSSAYATSVCSFKGRLRLASLSQATVQPRERSANTAEIPGCSAPAISGQFCASLGISNASAHDYLKTSERLDETRQTGQDTSAFILVQLGLVCYDAYRL
jgi:hypothetical protein